MGNRHPVELLDLAAEAVKGLGLPRVRGRAQAISPLGRPLRTPKLDPAFEGDQRQRLEDALAAFAADPTSPDALIWCGRRLGYLGDYRLAVGVFTVGIERFPGDARFLRHRGHRFITLRLFERAIADLETAWSLCEGHPDSLEPDGMPNARNEPTSTLHFNVLYHLGLAFYLEDRLSEAEAAYRRCLGVARHPDSTVATLYWLVLALLQQYRRDEAYALGRDLPSPEALIESGSYHELVLTLTGRNPVLSEPADALADATLGYGRAAHAWFQGDRERALTDWFRIAGAHQWAPFGVIASEAAVSAYLSERNGLPGAPAPSSSGLGTRT